MTIPMEETGKMDVLFSECQYLHPGAKISARIKQLTEALSLPEDALAYLLEISKFLGTVALIMIFGLVLLLAG